MVADRRLVRELHLGRARKPIRHRLAALGLLLRLAQVDRGRLGLAWNLLEVTADQRQRRVKLEVADQREYRIVGSVVSLEELRDVRDARRVEIFHRADGGMLVGEVAVEQLAETLIGGPVGLVVDAQPALFLYSLALVVELLLRDHQ